MTRRPGSSIERPRRRGLRLAVGTALAAMLLCLGAATSRAQEGGDLWYEIDSLPEAASASQGMNLSNPRDMLRSFIAAFEAEDYGRAAAALMIPDDAHRSPPELARMLGEVIDRQIWIAGRTIPDRPDATVDPLSEKSAAGESRRSITLGSVDLDRFPVSIRVNRYKAPEGPAVWLFSEDTVGAVPELFERHGPGWIEARLPEWWRERTGWSIRRWEVAALPALVLAASIIGLAIAAVLAAIRSHARPGWPARMVEAARVPLALFCAAVFTQITVNSALGFSGEITAILTPVLIAAIVIALVMAVLRVIDAGLDIVTRRYVGNIDDTHGRDDRHLYTSIYALRRAVALIAFLVGSGLVLWEIGAFRNIGVSLLASAGVLTVILGIAGQTVLGNILASLQIAIAKPIRIGDSVCYEGDWAYVEAIYYTFVRLRTWDDRRMIVPVQYFISHPFENWSMTDAKMTRTFALVLDHGADTDALRERFLEIARDDPDVMDGEMTKLNIVGHDSDGIECRFYATAGDPTSAWNMHVRLREAMLRWIRETHPEWWPRERLRVDADDEAPGLGAASASRGAR